MRDLSRTIGIILGIVGVVWILQGIDFPNAPQSFMTGDRTWVALGALAMLLGGAMLWKGKSRK